MALLNLLEEPAVRHRAAAVALGRMPLTYLRNRLNCALRAAFTREGTRPRLRKWRTESLPLSQACEHSTLPGLILLRQALTPDEVEAVRSMVCSVMLPPLAERVNGVHAQLARLNREVELLRECSAAEHLLQPALLDQHQLRQQAALCEAPPPPLRCATAWEWFCFEPARWMAPMLVQAHGPALELEQFEVFDKAPTAVWLNLRQLQSSADPICASGALLLDKLQSRLPYMLGRPSSECHFMQLQNLMRGASVTPHIDAPSPTADLIATLALNGPGCVSVGNISVRLDSGDVYALCGHARWNVPHAVCSSTHDRLSITFRYVQISDAASMHV